MKHCFRHIFYFLLFTFHFLPSHAQADSSHLRISLLTCSPGEELYATFGHTAIRITDSSSNGLERDVVFNYGTFNFDDDGFYLKFMRGKLMYYLSASTFSSFREMYVDEKRSITEQVLNLSDSEKRTLRDMLTTNLMPQNRLYKYDFFFDNCTTRPRDLIVKLKNTLPPLKAAMPAGTRFREAIHFYLNKNQQYWSKLGIDILLGKPCDAVMTDAQMQFLPDNLMTALDSSNTRNAYVLDKKLILAAPNNEGSNIFFTPTVALWMLLGIIILVSLSANRFARAFLQGFDGMLFFITGLIGILLIFMWTATDHQMCRSNFNLCWALPTHVVMALFINSKKNWVKKYFGFTALLMTVLLLAWFFLPQQMNNALIPVALLLLYRSAARYFSI